MKPQRHGDTETQRKTNETTETQRKGQMKPQRHGDTKRPINN